MRRTVRHAAEVADDHAEAVVEAAPGSQAVAVREAAQLGHEESVVEDVVVGEGGALRITRWSRWCTGC